jgi:hypothetical protein
LRNQTLPETASIFHKKEILMSVVFTVATFIVLWLRRPDCLLNAQFWAEDGSVFFQQQIMHGFWQSWPRNYSGYIHTFPRLIVWLNTLLPVRWAPLGINATTLAVEAICCSAFFWPCYRKIINSDSLRAACCLAFAASIIAGSELLATVCNVQWYLCILSLLLIVATTSENAAKWTEALLTVIQVLIALSAPVTLLLLPFLVWQLKTKPGWLKVRPAIHIAALLLQALAMHVYGDSKPIRRFNILFLTTFITGISRCVLSPILGNSFLTDSSTIALFTKMLFALVVGLVLATVLVVKWLRLPQMKWAWAAAYMGIGSLLAFLSGRGAAKEFVRLDGIVYFTGERYFFVGACMFIFCVAFALDNLTRRVHPHLATALFVCLFAFGTFKNYSSKPFQDFNWKDSAAKIDVWEKQRKNSPPPPTIALPINPPGWTIILGANN